MEPDRDVVASVAHRLAQKIEEVFPCGAPKNDPEKRKGSFTYLVSVTAKLGMYLVSQPDAYDFQWRPADELNGSDIGEDQLQIPTPGCLIIFPSLRCRRLLVDGSYSKPVALYEAEVEKRGA